MGWSPVAPWLLRLPLVVPPHGLANRAGGPARPRLTSTAACPRTAGRGSRRGKMSTASASAWPTPRPAAARVWCRRCRTARNAPSPDIRLAQAEIHRVLKPGGTPVAMLYSRASLNYQVSIRLVRRAVLAAAYPLRRSRYLPASPMLRRHLDNAQCVGLRRYLELDTFTHRNTDGPLNPFARVYSPREVAEDFPDFDVVDTYTRYMHAPPLPVRRLPAERWLGWHLWVHLRARPSLAQPDAPPLVDEAGRHE